MKRSVMVGMLVLCGWLGWSLSSSGGETLSLAQVMAEGKVKVEVSSLGGSTGDAILLQVRRTVPQDMRIRLDPGTVFKCTAGHAQDMVGVSIRGEQSGALTYRPASEIVLDDGDRHPYLIQACCLDFEKDNPGTSDSFALSGIDARAKAICEKGRELGMSIEALQVALWLDRGMDTDSIRARFAVSDDDVAAARKLLRAVKESSVDARPDRREVSPSAKPVVPKGHGESGQNGPFPADDKSVMHALYGL